MTRSAPEDEGKHDRVPPRHSASADAAALRREESEPVDLEAPPAPAADPHAAPGRPGGHSASAEAAALRWQEQHPDEED